MNKAEIAGPALIHGDADGGLPPIGFQVPAKGGERLPELRFIEIMHGRPPLLDASGIVPLRMGCFADDMDGMRTRGRGHGGLGKVETGARCNDKNIEYLLVFLLGIGGGGATVKSITFASGYRSVAIRQAAGEMALARLIRVTAGRPSEYLAPVRPWAELLGFGPGGPGERASGEPPPWRYWSEVFAFLPGVNRWAVLASSDSSPNPHVLASGARDVLEKHGRAFILSGIHAPPPSAFPGSQAPEGLAETTRVVSQWVQEMI